MKILITFFLITLSTSCNQDNKIITNNNIGNYNLKHILKDKNYNKEIFDITVNADDIITSIIIHSNTYKTQEGFGVGTSFNQLKKGTKQWVSKDLSLNKGSMVIGSVGNAIIYDNILFVDTNNDDITDFVWITTNS